MKRFKSKKGIALLATLVVVASAAIGAYAYFTNSGNTSGTPVAARTDASLTPYTVAFGTVTYACYLATDTGCSALAPAPSLTDSNSPVATVPFTVLNKDESDEYITSYTITLTGNNGCAASNFAINGTPYAGAVTLGHAYDATLPEQLGPNSDGAPGDTYSGSFTLQMVETSANQDVCQGAAGAPTIAIQTN